MRDDVVVQDVRAGSGVGKEKRLKRIAGWVAQAYFSDPGQSSVSCAAGRLKRSVTQPKSCVLLRPEAAMCGFEVVSRGLSGVLAPRRLPD